MRRLVIALLPWALALVLGVVLIGRCRPANPVSGTLQRQLDSLAITKAAFDSGVRAAERRNAEQIAEASAARAAAQSHAAGAATQRNRADSARAAFDRARTTADSLATLDAAYRLRTAEADSLRLALAASQKADSTERARADDLMRAFAEVKQRAVTLENKTVPGLERAVREANAAARRGRWAAAAEGAVLGVLVGFGAAAAAH